METVKLNLYQRISAVMADVSYLQKDDSVGFGNNSYKAITEEKVTETVRTALIKHGLVILPVEQVSFAKDNQRSDRTGMSTIVSISHVDTKYKIVNIDDPTQFEFLASSGDGVDSQDKGIGKAMTYAYKYMLLRTFAIPTGEDPDKIHNSELEAKQNQTAKKAEIAPDIELTNAIIDLKSSENREQALEAYNKYPQYKNDPDFLAAVKTMSEKYPKPTTT